MDKFAVLHITKYKTLARIGRHLDRKHISRNVDREKSGYNEELTQMLGRSIDHTKRHLREELSPHGGQSLSQDVALRIDKGYTKCQALRKDAVRALGVIMSGTHERMKEIEVDAVLFASWKEANYAFACQEFGQENIVRFSLHRDERTPHFHCVFVPITPDGSLSAKHFIGTPAKLRVYQDRYALAMEKFGLHRGIPRELTHREHVTTKDYYQSVNALAQEASALTRQVKRSNLMKLDTIREDLKKHITQLKVKAMEQELQCNYATVGNQSSVNNYSQRAYQERLVEESGLVYAWIKRAIPLTDFAVAKLGWSIVKEKSTKRDWVLEHPSHGRIIVPTRPKSANGHWVYSLPNQQGGGTLIDLLRQEKWDWKAIKELAHGYITIPVAELTPPAASYAVARYLENPGQQAALAQQRLDTVKARETGENYLARRGIAQEVYQSFSQLKTNKHQAVFGLYKDFDGEQRLCSTISYYFDREGERRKYFQKDLPRGLAQLSLGQDPTHIVITESPIDALSHRQLQYNSVAIEDRKQLDETMYLATCGNLSVEVNRSIEHVFERAKAANQEVILAFDNDVSGRKMTQELERLLQEKQCTYRVELPEVGKDWNESLMIKGRENAVQDFLVQDRLYGFAQVKYEDSILQKVGIPKEACHDIPMKVEEHSVVFGLHQNIASHPRLCSTVTYLWDQSGAERKYFQKDFPRGLAILSPEGEVKHIVITESPLEALKHREGNSQAAQTLYLCTCGSWTRGIQKELSQVFDQAKDQSIALVGLDTTSSVQLKRMLEEKRCTYKVPPNPIKTVGIHAMLSKVAHTLGTLARLNPGTSSGDHEEEEVKKRKTKGRRMGM